MISNNTDAIIIGAGPSGIACAMQLKRHNIDHVIFEKDEIGGLLRNAHLVENYPGFPGGISGEKFVQILEKQSKNNKLTIKYESVESVEFANQLFTINTGINIYSARYLVIASGTRPIIPEIPIIQNSIKDKVFFEIYKLGQIKNKNIAIIGAGDCAFDYALNLSNNNKVIILNRSNRIKALPILQDRVSKIDNIKYFNNTTVKKIESKNSKITLSCNPNIVTNDIDYLLIAIGREPNLDFINKDLLINPKVFQIGDVKNGQFRQTSIAVGNGTFTAMKINNILNQGD